MNLGLRMLRPAALRVCALVAAAAASAGARADDLRGSILPDPPARFGNIPENRLIVALETPRRAGPSAELSIFPRLLEARAEAASASPGPANAAPAGTPPPAAAPAEASAPPDPVPTAMALSLARVIVRDDRANPLGLGDWRAAKAAIGAFYAARGFQPIWVDADGLTKAGRAAVAAITRAPEDGLALSGLRTPRDLLAPLAPEALAAAEIAVAEGVVAYAEQATGSRASPARVSPIVSAAPQVADPGEALAETAAAADPGARLAEFNPPQRGYRALRESLKYLDDAADGGALRPDSAPLDLGASVSDAPAQSDDPLLGATGKAPARRRAYLASAAPQAALNAREQEREAIVANMEMWRWEPRDMGERRIEVNIPDFSVTVSDGDSVMMNSRVVVGKPGTPTPVFSDLMRYVLINPSWQVPDSIVKKEMLPRLDHFARLGYEVKSVGGRVVVRQPPGEGNALGRLAFMFPNDHAVYLHDTPARELFDEDMRALSHGCVRVEDPERLAEIVLDWPEGRLEAAIGGAERTVFLPRPLPIHIEYFTEFVDADGGLETRPDVYGLTQRVARTLFAMRQD